MKPPAPEEVYKVNDALSRLRFEKGLTKVKLAEGLNTSPNYIFKIENNDVQVKMEVLFRYAKFFKMKPSQILKRAEAL